MIKKLVYPKYFDVTPVIVYLVDGINEDGEENIIDTWTGKCNYSETSKRVQDKDGQWIHLSGVVHVCGDIFPNAGKIIGHVLINGQTMDIVGSSRPRNPDGSVNHTRLELI